VSIPLLDDRGTVVRFRAMSSDLPLLHSFLDPSVASHSMGSMSDFYFFVKVASSLSFPLTST
jgi:hypothetical protein